MPTYNLKLDPGHLAALLTIARKQRARQQVMFANQYGQNSPAVKESAAELAAIDAALVVINNTNTK